MTSNRIGTVKLKSFFADDKQSINPGAFPDETFTLFSIPSYDTGQPEIVSGSEIGSSKILLNDQDVLLSRIVPHIRRCWIVDANQKYRKIGSGEWIVFRSSNKIEPKYLRYYFSTETFRKKFLQTVRGVGGSLLRADPKQVGEFEVPLPSRVIQKRIATILDKTDNLREMDSQLLEYYNQLVKSIFYDMFGDPVRNEKGWLKVRMDTISEYVTKGESPNWQGYNYVDEGVRFITSENVVWGDLDLSKDKSKFIPHNFHQKLKRSQLEVNNLLVNLVGASIGRCALVSNNALPANINQAVASIKLTPDKIDNVYCLQLMINESFQKRLRGNIVEAARANISLTNIRNLEIPLPPITLQNRFSSIIKNIDNQKKIVQRQISESDSLFQILLRKAFKGELVNDH